MVGRGFDPGRDTRKGKRFKTRAYPSRRRPDHSQQRDSRHSNTRVDTMKQAKMKHVLIFSLILALFALIAYAATVSVTSPADGSYDLDGKDIIVNCTATPGSNEIIGNFSLFTNHDGTWRKNSTINISQAAGTEVAYGFNFAAGANTSIADGTNLI